MICNRPEVHDPHGNVIVVRENGTLARAACEGRTAPAAPQDDRPLQPRLAVDIARENLTQGGREAIEALLDAENERGLLEGLVKRAKRRESEARDEMLSALIAMPAGANNATPGKRIPDYMDVVRAERRSRG